MTISDFAYTYDAVGNRATRTTPNGIAGYTYDALNRLTQATQPDPLVPLQLHTETFTYDPVGNRTSSHLATGQQHDAANRLLEDSQFTYTYDAPGNLTSKTSKATGARTLYTYSVEHQLTQVEQFALAGGTTPILTARYRYDPLGRRIAKEVTQGATTTTTRYLYDHEDLLFELDGTNQVQARYTHGPGIDEPLSMLRGGATFFYHPDGLGSIWDLTLSTGTAAKSYTYDSFGNILTQPGAVANPYTYTGRELDSETGLYYYRARYYDPGTGRFLSEDPIGIVGGNNFYAYVSDDPVNYYDPFGLNGERRLINPFPGGVGSPGGPRIFFRSLQANRPVSENTARIIERAVIQAGVQSISISATTNGQHSNASFHNFGLAVDISRINGQPVQTFLDTLCDPNNPVNRLTQALLDQPGLAELVGPAIARDKEGKPITDPQRLKLLYSGPHSHNNHIHYSSRY